MSPAEAVREVVKSFPLPGRVIQLRPLGRGHIQDTFVVALEGGDGPRRFLLQRINATIFPDASALMDNIVRVTEHLAAGQGAAEAAPGTAPWREVLAVVTAGDGRPWHVDARGDAWRAYRLVEGASPFQEAPGPEEARKAAAAFGAFQRRLADLDPASLHETIPRFHDLGHRVARFDRAVLKGPDERVDPASPEIVFAGDRGLRLRVELAALTEAGLPVRVVHDDCKLNNVLFDDETGDVACIVDLDTVMPGHVLFDFGDMVRTMTCPAAEDERDLGRIRVDTGLFEAVAGGYLSEARSFLEPVEVESLKLAGRYMAFIIGLRFLTDHLEGDVYFRTERPDHNLERARAQFRLLERLEDVAQELEATVDREAGRASA